MRVSVVKAVAIKKTKIDNRNVPEIEIINNIATLVSHLILAVSAIAKIKPSVAIIERTLIKATFENLLLR